jgi:glyoxylase-like metal-dependent hydrolase (beta-lactamase superfamily II)
MTSQTCDLSWDTFVAPGELSFVKDLRPGEQYRTWSPITATLIAGQRDAVLVDPLMTITQANVLAHWVAARGKRLTTVYITHGHGDHHLGLRVILDRFPDAMAVATQAVVEHMRRQASPDVLASVWEAHFPGQIPANPAIAAALAEPGFELEGHELVVVGLGHTDTHDTTCLQVPDIGIVVAGDAAYNDVHPYLVECDPARRKGWISALDTIEALDPRAVIAGHKRAGRPDDPSIVEETRQYIRDFDQAEQATTTAAELYDRVLALNPDRVNPWVLWASAQARKP